MTSNDVTVYLKNLPFWEHISDDDKNLICGNLHPLHYEAGQSVHSGEANCLGALIIRRGILRTFLLSDEGKETTMFRLREGSICILSASCVLSVITFDVQIEAETNCDVLLIPSAVFQALMKRNIYVENFAYKLMTERFSDVISAVERMFFLNLQQRIAVFLIDESVAQQSTTLTLTQEQIAKAIGSAREAVSRNLKLLAKSGCIEVSRGTINILDRKQLYEIISA
ncbi:Crp/Fnr family transcriptional regulator [uncultured Clostridium sp.]|uniref:Crp/Fnr family transcriptional regulator n=1 Tax=uncultured Clostridium sp. TaxID=59620 RepID=UPI0025F22A85|nr:Crp/Fnr family transcriptional regulator [uncultured Clostridium sp.]